jgi:hypothetical protein
MSNFSETPTLNDLQKLAAVCQFFLDPKARAKQIEELSAMMIAADARIEAARDAEAKLALRVAELDRREAKVGDIEIETAARKDRVLDQQARLHDIAADIKTQGDRFKREKLRYAGAAEHFNERLQDLPDWDALAQMVLGQPDAHYDDDSVMAVTEGVPGAAGSTLTRSNRPPRPTRADMVRGV